MKKTNIAPLAEIKAEDIQQLNDYLEEAFGLVSADLLGVSEGVATGLNATLNDGFNNRITVSSGVIFQNRVFGELEGAGSGFIVTLPVAGTKTDTIVASYQEVEDTPTSGYVLLDTVTRVETVKNFNNRKFGAVKLELLEDTNAASAPSGKIVVAEITSNTGGITEISTTNREHARIQGLSGDKLQISEVDARTIEEAFADLEESLSQTSATAVYNGRKLTSVTTEDDKFIINWDGLKVTSIQYQKPIGTLVSTYTPTYTGRNITVWTKS